MALLERKVRMSSRQAKALIDDVRRACEQEIADLRAEVKRAMADDYAALKAERDAILDAFARNHYAVRTEGQAHTPAEWCSACMVIRKARAPR